MSNKAVAVKPARKFGVVSGGRRADMIAGKPEKAAMAISNVAEALPATDQTQVQKDYFVERNGVKYAGTHLLIELWGAKNLGDLEITERALRDCTTAAGATLLHIHLHHFGPNAGLSGVAVLAESHISIHTWPERGYAALDVFMCGACDPYKAVPILRAAFEPDQVQLAESKRGIFA